jgi:hypothetical protein
MAPSFDWWAKESHRGTPVVVKMQMPNNWFMIELESPLNGESDDVSIHKGKNKNAKQLTWVLLLKAHKAAGCLTSIATAVRRRVSSGRTDTKSRTTASRFYSCIKVFLWVSILLLEFEFAAYYYKGFHITTSDLQLHSIYSKWFRFGSNILPRRFSFLQMGVLYCSLFRVWID